MLKVNNGNNRKRCKISSKLTIITPERRHWRHSGALIVWPPSVASVIFFPNCGRCHIPSRERLENWKNLTCFVLLLLPFWNSPFCLITDEFLYFFPFFQHLKFLKYIANETLKVIIFWDFTTSWLIFDWPQLKRPYLANINFKSTMETLDKSVKYVQS